MKSGLVLVTGGTGLIGENIVRRLLENGFQVVTIGRSQPKIPQCPHLCIDLLDKIGVTTALNSYKNVSVVIHLAAIAHGQHPPKNYTTQSANVQMVRNLVGFVNANRAHFVLASSVSVYSEDDCIPIHAVGMATYPTTEYGKSKLECENIVFDQFENADILRLAPVFCEGAMKDVAKRVYFPGTKFRLKVFPSPLHSLCSISTVESMICSILKRGPSGHWVHQVSDAKPFSQAVLLGWFSGVILPFPFIIARLLMRTLAIIPGSKAYGLRCALKKFSYNNVYPPCSVHEKC